MNSFRSEVSGYGKRSGRDHLPWRQTRDPYRVLVSEMMLQQTQVDRVIPFYARWLEMFPTAEALAKADLSTVLRLWSGLGYNRRAKFLHEAAKVIVSRHAGAVPREYAALRSLPGVGEYTAKAVRVFAYGEPESLIETNVRTVFLHHFFPRGRNVADTRLVPLIAAAVEGQEPRAWYAALMDYGTYLKATRPNPSRKSKHHMKQEPFEGSLRQARGKILRAVLAGVPATSVRAELGARFAPALASLEKEGLLARG